MRGLLGWYQVLGSTSNLGLLGSLGGRKLGLCGSGDLIPLHLFPRDYAHQRASLEAQVGGVAKDALGVQGDGERLTVRRGASS